MTREENLANLKRFADQLLSDPTATTFDDAGSLLGYVTAMCFHVGHNPNDVIKLVTVAATVTSAVGMHKVAELFEEVCQEVEKSDGN